MGQMEFKMERIGLCQVGDVLKIQEFELPNSYYYVLGRAFAMSANYKTLERIKAREGKVIDIRETPKGFFVMVEYED